MSNYKCTRKFDAQSMQKTFHEGEVVSYDVYSRLFNSERQFFHQTNEPVKSHVQDEEELPQAPSIMSGAEGEDENPLLSEGEISAMLDGQPDVVTGNDQPSFEGFEGGESGGGGATGSWESETPVGNDAPADDFQTNNDTDLSGGDMGSSGDF